MNAYDLLKIAPFVNNCPNCKSDKIGNGEGSLKVDDNTFTRTCKCGFEITIDSNNSTSKAVVKKTVEDALSKFKTI